MQKFAFVLFIFIALKANGQYDTSNIRRVFEYLTTRDFMQAHANVRFGRPEDLGKMKKKDRRRMREYRKADSTRWANTCFISFPAYFVPNVSRNSCQNRVVLKPYYLDSNLIELRLFEGTYPFGTELQWRFRINSDLSVTFIKENMVIYN